MPDFNRQKRRFFCNGVGLNTWREISEPDKYPKLENIRINEKGVIQARKGYVQIGSGQFGTPGQVHSITRLTDKPSGVSLRIVGEETSLFSETGGTFTSRATGYSGNPLTMVPYRPDQASQTWAYLGDRTKLSKIDTSGTVRNIGITPPTDPPIVRQGKAELTVPVLGTSFSSWIKAGTATGSLLSITRQGVGAVVIVVAKVLDDNAYSSGWDVLGVGSGKLGDDIVEQMMIQSFASGGGFKQNLEIDRILPEIVRINRGSALQFDSGTTGWATVSLVHSSTGATWDKNIQLDSILSFSATSSETVRVAEIITGPNNERCIRVFFASSHSTYESAAAGGSLTISSEDGLRILNDSSGAVIVGDKLSIVHAGIKIGDGVGSISRIPSSPLDWSNTAGTGGGTAREIRPDDLMHVSIRIDDTDKIVEGRLLIDVADDSVSGGSFTGSEFTKNYFFKGFRTSDLTPALKFTQTIVTTSTIQVQRLVTQEQGNFNSFEFEDFDGDGFDDNTGESIDGFQEDVFETVDQEVTTSVQIQTGEAQWTELIFRVSELTRVGTDLRRGLDNSVAFRLSITATNSPPASEVQVEIGGWYIRGGSGPDVHFFGIPYLYRYRARSTTTGATSNPSPPSRNGITARRDQITVTITTAHADPQVDVLDIFRFGGNVSGKGQWRYVGTVDNTNGATLEDRNTDLQLLPREELEFDFDQPFTTIDLPKSGTCDIVGSTVVQQSGDNFDTSWAPGTVIKVGKQTFVLFNQPLSTTLLHLADCAESATGVTWQVVEPVLLGTPLAHLWGPTDNVLFAVGDTNRPGYLYWTRGNNADSAPSFYNQEVTQPTDPLMSGFVFGARSFVFSTEQIYSIWPDNVGLKFWRIFPTRAARGLWARWAFTVGPKVWYLGKDGIYEFDGISSVSITDQDLYSLFPHESQPGVAVNGFNAVDMSDEAFLRLTYHNNYLYFLYKDSAGANRSLVYDISRKAWLPDKYKDTLVVGYSEVGDGKNDLVMGSENGKLVLFDDAPDDNTFAIDCTVETKSETEDDPQMEKKYGDVAVQFDRDGETVTFQALTVQGTVVSGTTVVSAGSGVTLGMINLGTAGTESRDIAFRATWSGSTGAPKLYYWAPTYREKPVTREQRLMDWNRYVKDHAVSAYVWGIRIKSGTGGVAKVMSLFNDGADTGINITINTADEQWTTHTWAAFRGDMGSLRSDDLVPWQLFEWEWLADKEPPLEPDLDTNWQSAAKDCQTGYVTGVEVVMDTLNVQKTLIFESEFEGTVTVLTAQEGANTLTHIRRLTKTFSFTPFRAEQLRVHSIDGVRSRTYKIAWCVHPEPPVLANWDATFEDFGKFVLLTGIAIYADTLGNAKTVRVELDGALHQTLTVNQARKEVIYPLNRTGSPSEFPKASTARLLPTDVEDCFFYRARWIAQEEPELISNWNAAWKKISQGGQDAILRGVEIEADTLSMNKTIQVVLDQTVVATLTVNFAGRQAANFPIARDANGEYPRGKVVRLIPTDSNPGQLYTWEPIADLEPAGIENWNTKWNDAGVPGPKFFQGFRLTADTQNVQKTFNIESDGGTVRATALTVTNKVKETTPFSFATPFIANNVRVIPTDSNQGWLYGVEWVFEPMPEEAVLWETQETTFDLPGYIHARDMWIAVSSNASFSLDITIKFNNGVNTILRNIGGVSGEASTSDQMKKFYLDLPANKGVGYKFKIESVVTDSILIAPPVRLWVRDTEVRVKPWGHAGSYLIVKPFGDMSRKDGAKI